MATGERPVDEKFSHAEVKYVRVSDRAGQDCDNCKHVIEATSGTRCQSVASPIYLTGWCERYKRKT
jgi:hypothetical protein